MSPYCKMDSLYFDNSLYENEMHFKLAKYFDEFPLDPDGEQVIIDCKNEKEFNDVLDALYHYKNGKLCAYGTSINPMEIIVEADPRDKYRKFDEKFLLDKKIEV